MLIERLKRIQNCAARLITRSRKSEHITPVLRELHWLPVKYRLRFKVNTFTYKVLNGLAPIYMSDIVLKHQPTRSLRSTEKSLIVVPVLRTATERCFSRHAAILWNDLPENIKQLNTLSSFKKHLKHIFLNWHTTDVIESRSRFNDIAIYQWLIYYVLFMCVL